jgi:acetaldehyde dehydrogenase (acetylating)
VRWLLAVGAAAALTPAASAGLPNPCRLLTNAEAAKLLVSKVAARDASGNRLYTSCTWTGANLGRYAPTHRSLAIQVSRSTKAQFEKAAGKLPGAIRVTGVGEAAFTQRAGGGSFLNVYARGYGLELIASLVTSPLEVEKRAATTALKRL